MAKTDANSNYNSSVIEICTENYGKTRKSSPTASRETRISFLEVVMPEQDLKEPVLTRGERHSSETGRHKQSCGAMVCLGVKCKAGRGRDTVIFSESVS